VSFKRFPFSNYCIVSFIYHVNSLFAVFVGKVKVHNVDGEEFIRSVMRPDLLQRWSQAADTDSFHVVMNLPSLAIEFLRVFRGLLSTSELEYEPPTSLLPLIHCYCFSQADDTAADAADRTSAALEVSSFADLKDSHIRVVRNVAPSKEMLCVTFRLPWHLLATDEHGLYVYRLSQIVVHFLKLNFTWLS